MEYWVSQMPSSFGKQAVFLIGSSNGYDQQVHMSKFNEYKAKGFPILAPPQQLLVKPSGHKYAPSPFAEAIKAHGGIEPLVLLLREGQVYFLLDRYT